MEWDYTGTAWISYLKHTTPLKSAKAQYEAVRDADAKNGLTWLPVAPMNNTYSFAARSGVAEELGVSTLADLKKVPKAKRTFCVDSEFAARDDGFQPMLEAYGLKLGSDVPRSQVKTLDAGAIYDAVSKGVCTFGEVFTTDGRIKSLHLTVLSDPKQFFPLYNVAPVVTTSTLRHSPQLAQLFAPVAKKLTNKTMIDLNAQVDVDGKEPSEVAEKWLKEQHFLK